MFRKLNSKPDFVTVDSDHSISVDLVLFDYKNWDYYVALGPGEMLMFRK